MLVLLCLLDASQVFGGSTGEEATSEAHVLAMDTLKWTLIAPASIHQPSPRLMHAAACIRDKVRRALRGQQQGKAGPHPGPD